MLPAEILKKIKNIHIRTTHLVNAVMAGEYESAFRGLGMEFEEVREYQPGDEIRTIDWNVTARTGHPYVKRYRDRGGGGARRGAAWSAPPAGTAAGAAGGTRWGGGPGA